MKSLYSSERGAGHLVAILAIAVLLVVGYVGWRVAGQDSKSADTATATVTRQASPSTLKTKADITSAANELNATAVDSTVNPNQLDSDINTLL